MILEKQKGFILIFALWVLCFLTVLAVGVASSVRQKIVVLEKLDQRSRISHVLEAAVKYSASYITNQLSHSNQTYSTNLKMNLHSNSEVFGQFGLAEDTASISYSVADQGDCYGVVDEERKINLNVMSVSILGRLIERVLEEKPDAARTLAESILDWRQLGESQVSGFFSDEYYNNLEYPYAKKDAAYETLDELLLVKGMTKDKYLKLINYVTIYGEGKVNINTASSQVLYALGLEDSLIEKVIEVRQGQDKLEASFDDHVFIKTFDVATEINNVIKLLPEEIQAIDALNKQNLLTTNSYCFSIHTQAHLAHRSFSKEVHAIFSSRENKIVYWKER
ncbi:MAG: general secretion pathway protein GspK [Candidatus Omnitrophica bacterium]|nr:general secretion pathway protein GspK [Candidatus Omnitrophota bacterium]